MDDKNKERVTGFMHEEGNAMNAQKDSMENKLIGDAMDALIDLVDISMKMSAKFTQMPESELTDDEKKFIAATAKAGLTLMMGASVLKTNGGK